MRRIVTDERRRPGAKASRRPAVARRAMTVIKMVENRLSYDELGLSAKIGCRRRAVNSPAAGRDGSRNRRP